MHEPDQMQKWSDVTGVLGLCCDLFFSALRDYKPEGFPKVASVQGF